MLTQKQDVAAIIATGKFWRAKQVLQGRLAGAGYDRELFRDYGIVLLKMGDLRIAGKYLFLSGYRSSEWREAIDIFERSDCKGSFSSFWGQMPKAAHKASRAEIPTQVIEDLVGLGFTCEEMSPVIDQLASAEQHRRRQDSQDDKITRQVQWGFVAIVSFCSVLLVGLLYQAVIGVIGIVGLLLRWLY